MNSPLPLAWRDALAAVPPGTFSQAEAAAGWPQALTPEQLARLQRPYTTHKDRTAYRACQALAKTIAEAVASGELPHTVQQHSTPERWEQRLSLFDVYDRDHPASDGASQYIPAKSWQTQHITPEAARAWLAAQGEAPSKHVAVWFAGAGLQSAEVGAPIQAHAIVPPHGWELHSPHGFLGSDAGPLVRLADVVAWLMTTREKPTAEAVEAVAAAIEGAGIDGVYGIDPEHRANSMARPSGWDELLLPAEDRALGMSTAKARELAAMIRSSWLRDPTERLNPEDYPPFDPARIAPGDPATRWAVTHEKAHALWGWGEAVESQTQRLEADPAPLLKKNLLIAELEGEWPAIENDLNNASKNGLRAAAWVRHGIYDPDKARDWAEANGRLSGQKKSETVVNGPWAGGVHRHTMGG